jgi:hypothetical protein
LQYIGPIQIQPLQFIKPISRKQIYKNKYHEKARKQLTCGRGGDRLRGLEDARSDLREAKTKR